ncbi:MAG: DUF3990 domain-containing protein [Mogibacterium sp.]|nr:DUF3990 domain-containing protein [Mogibacterium sp.]
MNRNIYHGSKTIIRSPKFGTGWAYNDFGLGFYCCENPENAAEWAASRDSGGFISAYMLDCSGLRIIDLCSSQYSLLHWLYVLLMFREFDPSGRIRRAKEYISKEFSLDYQASDCIIGYRADNSNFALAADFLNGKISYELLRSLIAESSAGRQFVLKSNRAFERILYTGYETIRSSDYYPLSVSAELARMKKAKEARDDKGLYITQMIEEDIKSYDTRLR